MAINTDLKRIQNMVINMGPKLVVKPRNTPMVKYHIKNIYRLFRFFYCILLDESAASDDDGEETRNSYKVVEDGVE